MKFVATLVLFLSILVSCTEKSKNDVRTSSLRTIKPAPQFQAITSAGTPVSQEILQGKVWLAYFFFTSCGGPCPTMNKSVARVMNEFQSENSLRAIGFTVDPQNDSITTLARYAVTFQADTTRWIFGRTSESEIKELTSKGFLLGSPENPSEHSAKIALVDKKGIIRGYFSGTDSLEVEQLKDGIRVLLKE